MWSSQIKDKTAYLHTTPRSPVTVSFLCFQDQRPRQGAQLRGLTGFLPSWAGPAASSALDSRPQGFPPGPSHSGSQGLASVGLLRASSLTRPAQETDTRSDEPGGGAGSSRRHLMRRVPGIPATRRPICQSGILPVPSRSGPIGEPQVPGREGPRGEHV